MTNEPSPAPSAPKRHRFPFIALGAVLVLAIPGALYLESTLNKPPPKTVMPELPEPRLRSKVSASSTPEIIGHKVMEVMDENLSPQTPLHLQGEDKLPDVIRDIAALREEVKELRKEVKAAADSAQSQAAGDSVLIAYYEMENLAISGKPFYESLHNLIKNPDLPNTLRPALRELTTVAHNGIPTPSALKALFADCLKIYTAYPEGASASSFSGNLKAGLRGLISIRKVGAEHVGTDDASRIARAETFIGEENFAAALEELKMLSPDATRTFKRCATMIALHLQKLDSLAKIRREFFYKDGT